MFLSNHAAVGALLAVHTDNPASAFVLGYFSHYLLDMIPHGDEKVSTWMKEKHTNLRSAGVFLADLSITAIFFLSLSWKIDFPHPYVVAAGVFGAMLPDFLYGFYDLIRKYLSPEKKKHYREKGGWLIKLAKRTLWDNFLLERHFYIHRKIHFALGYNISFPKGMIFQAVLLGFLYWSTLNYLSV